jgi:glucose/mannose-6-phosphate isomerase
MVAPWVVGVQPDLLVSTSGGTLEEWSRRDGVPISRIDFPDMQPRHTLFAAFTGIAQVLASSGLADDSTNELERVASALQAETPQLENTGKELAEKMKGKVPVFTSTDALGFAAKNFKIQTNENAKHPAFWNTFPELNHNELLGFSKLKEMENPNQFFVLMLRDAEDHPRNKVRMDVTADLYRSWGVTVEEFSPPGETLLERLFVTITLGMWTSYYLALAYGIDPVPVEGVESFKAKLKEVAGEL